MRLRRLVLRFDFVVANIAIVRLRSGDATSFAALAGEFTIYVAAQTARAGEGSVASYSAGVARVAGDSVTTPASFAVG